MKIEKNSQQYKIGKFKQNQNIRNKNYRCKKELKNWVPVIWKLGKQQCMVECIEENCFNFLKQFVATWLLEDLCSSNLQLKYCEETWGNQILVVTHRSPARNIVNIVFNVKHKVLSSNIFSPRFARNRTQTSNRNVTGLMLESGIVSTEKA